MKYLNERRFRKLKHPHIIAPAFFEDARLTKKNSGTENISSLLVMEYASHGNLYHVMETLEGNIPEKLVRTMFGQIIGALEYLHKKGVAHMDLKLGNVLISKNYNLKIADFDLSATQTDTSLIGRGTKNYRAPELLAGSESLEVLACDIYSVGVVLFVLLSGGILPFIENWSDD
jgi:serine/threonine protein kinase